MSFDQESFCAHNTIVIIESSSTNKLGKKVAAETLMISAFSFYKTVTNVCTLDLFKKSTEFFNQSSLNFLDVHHTYNIAHQLGINIF